VTTFEQDKAALLKAELERVGAETARLERRTRLTLAAHERGVPMDLVDLVDRGEDDDATMARIDQLQVLVKQAAADEVDARFAAGGRSPRGLVSPEARMDLARMTPQQFAERWPQIRAQLPRGNRKRR